VIDFLPEVQTARSFEIFWVALFSSDSADFLETCLIDQPSVDSIPDHLLVDINGALRTRDESVQLALDTLCIFAGLFEPSMRFDDDFSDSDQALELFLNVLRGEAVEFPTGVVLDGSKQIFRMGAAFQMFGFFGLGDPLLEALDPDGDADKCAVLSSAAVNGETLELRFLALFNLAFEMGDDLMNDAEDGVSPTDSVCGEVSTAPLSELRSAAATGDLQAAVNLAGRQFGDVLIFVGEEPDESERVALEAQLAELELDILSNTERFPLVALADSTTIFIIELALSFIDGEFGE